MPGPVRRPSTVRVTRLDIHRDLLPYAGCLEARRPEHVDLLVIHCTELPDLATAREFGERILYGDSGTGNSGHFYIERSGAIQEWVPVGRVAHHVRGYNERSVGVELVNLGRYPNWFASDHQAMTEPYPDAQIESLVGLTHHLKKLLPSLRWIAGHESLDSSQVAATDDVDCMVRRKRDPGPLFPWSLVLEQTGLKCLAGTASTDR